MTGLEKAITSVAVLIDTPESFRTHAALVAQELGVCAINDLTASIHAAPRFGYEQYGLCWLKVWNTAIYEILFQYGGASLSALRALAFGVYDGLQFNAVVMMFRLAAAGVERAQIVAELRHNFANLQSETAVRSVWGILYYAAQDKAIAGLVLEFKDLPQWQRAIRELQDELEPGNWSVGKGWMPRLHAATVTEPDAERIAAADGGA